MIQLILISVVGITGIFLIRFGFDLKNHKGELGNTSIPSVPVMVSTFITFFLSTFGISDFAFSTVVYRKLKWINDENLPGTLNTQSVLPLSMMALIYISGVPIDPLTLVLCIIAQVIGSYIGPRFVVKLPVNSIRKIVGIGLLLSMIIIVANNTGIVPSGGSAVSLRGWKLGLAIVALFIFGALNNIGIGSFALTMVTMHGLGLNPIVAFPIMMGAASLSIAVGSIQFIKFDKYSRKITFISSICGFIAVIIASKIVKGLDVLMLQWVVAAVLAYSGGEMLIQQYKLAKYKT